MKKKISPTKLIESVKFPWLESGYMKYPENEIVKSDTKRELASVEIVYHKNRFRSNVIHTHQNLINDVRPSRTDIINFLTIPEFKLMAIAQTNFFTGKVKGYLVVRKTKKTSPLKNRRQVPYAFPIPYTKYFLSGNYNLTKDYLKNICKNFSLQYRVIPAKDYVVGKSGFRFVKKESKLEDKVAGIISLAGLGLGIFFLSSNISGNVVGSLNQTSSNWIGGILFIVGIVAGFFWLRNKKVEIKKSKRSRKRRK